MIALFAFTTKGFSQFDQPSFQLGVGLGIPLDQLKGDNYLATSTYSGFQVTQIDTTDFLVAYENLLLKFGTDYEKVVHKTLESEDDKTIGMFYYPGKSYVESFENFQLFDFEGIKYRY